MCTEKQSEHLVNTLDGAAVVGVNGEGKEVFLKDVWPSKEEVQYVEEHMVISSMFTELRSRMQVSSGPVVGVKTENLNWSVLNLFPACV